jgi:biotin carboxyl carrier protein
MDLPIVAPAGGTVKSVPISAGQNVEAGDVLAVIEG